MRNKEKEQRQKIMALYQQAAARGEMQFDFSQGGWGAHRQGPRFLTVAEGEALRKSSTLIPQQEAAEIAALKAEIERLNARLKVLQDAFQLDVHGDGFIAWSPTVKKALYGEVES